MRSTDTRAGLVEIAIIIALLTAAFWGLALYGPQIVAPIRAAIALLRAAVGGV